MTPYHDINRAAMIYYGLSHRELYESPLKQELISNLISELEQAGIWTEPERLRGKSKANRERSRIDERLINAYSQLCWIPHSVIFELGNLPLYSESTWNYATELSDLLLGSNPRYEKMEHANVGFNGVHCHSIPLLKSPLVIPSGFPVVVKVKPLGEGEYEGLPMETQIKKMVNYLGKGVDSRGKYSRQELRAYAYADWWDSEYAKRLPENQRQKVNKSTGEVTYLPPKRLVFSRSVGLHGY